MQKSIQNCALLFNAQASFVLTSLTTPQNTRRHAILTRDKRFAMSLYEQALNISEPDLAAYGGEFTVEFVANDAECAEVLLKAQGVFRC